MDPVRLASDVAPILLSYILVYLNRDIRNLEPVSPALFAPGNPVILAGGLIVVVGLEAAANDPPEHVVTLE